MKALLWVVVALAVLVGLFFALNSYIRHEELGDNPMQTTSSVQVTPIAHATAVLQLGDSVIYTDPTGDAAGFAGQPAATIVVVTDIHQDHFSTSTLEAVLGEAALVVPKAVLDLLPADLAAKATVLANGETKSVNGVNITGVAMYNLPESPTAYHTKGRGNGYILEKDGVRIYVAGDTSGTPEMHALTNIDTALVPMNLPYTMSVDEAAEAVVAFRPAHVYPYHYRGQDGLADVNRFKELVNTGDPDIDVELLNWYP